MSMEQRVEASVQILLKMLDDMKEEGVEITEDEIRKRIERM